MMTRRILTRAALSSLAIILLGSTAMAASPRATGDIQCDTDFLGRQSVGISLDGALPVQVSQGQDYYLKGLSGTLTVPTSVVNAMISLGGSYFDGEATSLIVTATNSDPEYIDVMDPAGAIPEYPLISGQPVTITLPLPPMVGPFTVNPDATGTVVLGLAGSAYHLIVRDANHNPILDPSATCAQPDPSLIIASAPIG